MTLARECVLPSRSLPDMKSASSTTKMAKVERSRSDTTQPLLLNTLLSSATTTTTLDTEPRRFSNASLMSSPFIGLMAGRKSVCHPLLHNEVELKIIVEPRDETLNENNAQIGPKSTKITNKIGEKDAKIDEEKGNKEETVITIRREGSLRKSCTSPAAPTRCVALITKPPAPSTTDKNSVRRRGLKQRANVGGSNVFEAYQNSIQERASTNASVASVQGSRSTPSSPSGSRRVSWADDDSNKAKTERSAFERGSRTRVTWSVGKSSAISRTAPRDRERSRKNSQEISRISQNEIRSNHALNVDSNPEGRSPSPVGLGQSFKRFGRKWLGMNKL